MRCGRPFSLSMILTIGHSTHPIEKLIEMLQAHGVERLIDVRAIPKSRRNPQFNRDELERTIPAAGVEYRHMPELGGLRHPKKDSINSAWKNDSFRGYADYMQTPEFERAIEELIAASKDPQIAVMCAESVPWRCHRSLIADALVARGIPVEHIMSASSRKLHTFTPFARIENERVTYPGVA